MAEIGPGGKNRRLTFHFLLGGVALCMAVWAGRWGLAGFYAIPADRVLEAWQDVNSPLPPDTPSWEMVVSYSEQARDLESGNADHHFRLASLYHHRAVDLPPWDIEANKLFEQSAIYYRLAVQLRPSWGYGWINLALVQVQSGHISEDTIRALKRGMLLAPKSTHVQKSAIRLGFALWSQLDSKTQQNILTVIEKVLPNHGDFVLTQAQRYGQLTLIRPVVAKFPVWKIRLEQMMEGHGDKVRG